MAYYRRFASRMPLRCLSSSSKTSWSNNTTLPGGFNADGLREWAVLTDFGAEGYENMTGQEMRLRRRQLDSLDPKELPYVDLFSEKVSDECKTYLANHPSPSDVLARSFFGTRSFLAERVFLTSMNALFALYPKEATHLPNQFNMDTQYLHWRVRMASPLELILSYRVEGLNFRGCTMLAFDPSLREVYHGNCFDVAEERLEGLLPNVGIQLHVNYAEFLVSDMAAELEKLAEGKRVDTVSSD